MSTIHSLKNSLLFLVRTTIVLGLIALAPGDGGGAPAEGTKKASWAQSRASQLVFFAVLEGLYGDGMSNDEVDLIIPPGQDRRPTFDREHFVYACPLCHPAYEALVLYRQRPSFFGMKAPVDNFGPGLDAALVKGLRSPDATRRREVIEGLIHRWVTKRLELMRLSTAERQAITLELEEGRKQGMGMLKQSSQTRTNCPICDGSFGACKLPGR